MTNVRFTFGSGPNFVLGAQIVPEPGSIVLGATSLAALSLCLFARRRQGAFAGPR
jgi:hypothetical protein